MDRNLAGLRGEHVAVDADDVAHVEQFLENRVVERLVLAGTNIVAPHVDLHPPGGILQLGKRGVAHDAKVHEPPGQRYILVIGLVAFVVFHDVADARVHVKTLSGIRFNAQLAQLPQFVAPDNFLLTQLHCLFFVYVLLARLMNRPHGREVCGFPRILFSRRNGLGFGTWRSGGFLKCSFRQLNFL